MQQMMKAPTLAEYRAQCDRETCSFDGGKLSIEVTADEHSDGWHVEGLNGLQWLSVECQDCGCIYSLDKLGVPRPFGKRSVAERAKLDPGLETNE